MKKNFSSWIQNKKADSILPIVVIIVFIMIVIGAIVVIGTNKLGNVQIYGPLDGQVLTYNSTGSFWYNAAPAGGPGGGPFDASVITSGQFDQARIPTLSISHLNITDWSSSMDWSYIQNKPLTFAPSAHTHSVADILGSFSISHSNISDWSSYIDQALTTGSSPSFSQLYVGGTYAVKISNNMIYLGDQASHYDVNLTDTTGALVTKSPFDSLSLRIGGTEVISSSRALGAVTAAAGIITSGQFDQARIPSLSISTGNISDVQISSVSNNQVLQYNSTSGKWVNSALALGNGYLSGLSDVTINSMVDGQFLKYNGTSAKWYNSTLLASDIPSLAASKITSGTFGTSYLDLSALAQNIAFTGAQTVDGVDISALLLKTTKVTDLGSIWDKTTKIAYGDTNFADQALNQASSPTFAGLALGSIGPPSSAASPTNINLGSKYSNTAGANPKLFLYNDNGGLIEGIGVSAGQMDFISSNGVAYSFYNGATKLVNIDTSGNLVVAGTETISGSIVINGNQIRVGDTVNGAASLYFNYAGYAGGATQYRNTYIFDGKNGDIANFVGGGNPSVEFFSTTQFDTTLSAVGSIVADTGGGTNTGLEIAHGWLTVGGAWTNSVPTGWTDLYIGAQSLHFYGTGYTPLMTLDSVGNLNVAGNIIVSGNSTVTGNIMSTNGAIVSKTFLGHYGVAWGSLPTFPTGIEGMYIVVWNTDASPEGRLYIYIDASWHYSVLTP
jgi:hypothetical protein